MKKMKKILSFLLAFTMTFSCLSGIAYAAVPEISKETRPADGVTEEQPFAPGTGGSNNFRIPCLVTLDDGTIVAACDARWNHAADGCCLDTIVSYSKDNGETWNYTFANYLGDYGNQYNGNSSAYIDPAIATDGETVYMIADLYPAGVSINTGRTDCRAQVGHTGYDENHNLVLAKATDTVNGVSATSERTKMSFDYTLVKIAEAKDTDASYYNIIDKEGNVVPGYTIDAFFNIKGEGVDTNLFIGDSPYFPWPTDFLYMTKSTDGGATWSIPTLIDLKKAEEQTLLVGPGRGIVVDMPNGKERIIFTAYDFTNVDDKSSAIYSDDGGKTWTRGADVANWSSESVVTEADGRLYVFTRHGNCYYVSEDGGETWGPAVSVPKPYNSNCQLTAITYSEKIDGKTAILFAVPSNTSSRSAGKIYVALVQEDGSLDWAYEYSINGAAYYAYSCMDELSNGDIALLYESAGAAITYTNIEIEDVVAGAAIGDIWFNDAEGPVSSLNMKPGDSATLTLDGALEGAALNVVCGNEEAVTVTVEGTTVTVNAVETVTGLEIVEIVAKAGDAETTLTVHVAEADNYEIVNMSMGETVTFTDETGNYEASVDLTTVDTTVAEVIVKGDEGTNPDESEIEAATLKLGTTVDFADSSAAASNALFTVASTFNMSATDSNGNTIYLEPYATTNGNGYPNVTSAVALTAVPTNTENIFYINGNGGYLHFHDGRYDRVTTTSGFEAGCSFMFYEAVAAGATASTEIPGFKVVSEVKPGGQYLIVAANGGAYYVMYPTTAKTNGLYTQVAKVTGESVDGVATVQLGNSTAFAGEKISAADCLYTYTAAGTTVSGNANGTTVYLNLGEPSKPTTTTAENIRITESEYTDGAFEFYGTANGRYLHFHDDSVKFNRCGSNDANHSFEVYKVAETPSVSDTITGYVKVTELSEILAGGQFLITRQADDDNYYVLYPTTNTGSVYNYVGRVQNFELPGPSTEITINAVGEGQTSVEVNGLTYYIVVDNEEKDIILEVGESIKFAGAIQKMDETQTVVSLTNVEEMAPYKAVEEVTEGKFLIASGSHVIVNAPTKLENADPTGLDMAYAVFEKGELEVYLWTLTAVNGGYTIKDANGQYITFNGNSVVLSDTAQTFVFADDVAGGLSISSNGMYLNNFSRANDRVAGWTGNDCPWVLYEASTGIEITAKEAGSTVITLGGVNYNITVKGEEEPEVPEVPEEPEVPEQKEEVCKVFSDVKHGEWYEEAVQYVYDNGIMNGNNNKFNPTAAIKREQVVATLFNMESDKTVTDYTAVDELKDVKADQWYTDAVCWAYNTGVAKGNPNTKMFSIGKPITREQLVVMLHNYSMMKGYDVSASADYSALKGAKDVSDYAEAPMEWAYGIEMIGGNGNLNPKGETTRAQMASMMKQFVENVVQK